MYLQLIYTENKKIIYLQLLFSKTCLLCIYSQSGSYFRKADFFFNSQAASRCVQACPWLHGFQATREGALLAQTQKYCAEEDCDVSKYTSKRNGHRYETVLFPLTTCVYLGAFPNSCEAEERQCHCTWWKCSRSSKWEQPHATNWRWMSLTIPGSSLTNLTNSGLKTTKALSQAVKMENLVSFSNRGKGSASSFPVSHPDKKVG